MGGAVTYSNAELKRRLGIGGKKTRDAYLPGDAIVLLSGGLDSATALAIARSQGFIPHCLTVHYGQRHRIELVCATALAAKHGLDHVVVDIPIGALARSALTRSEIDVPKDTGLPPGVPSTYVPARNTVLLGLALSWAESLGARDIFVGFNVIDASGYPDCRPEFVRAFQALATVATECGDVTIRAPLIEMSKPEIIRTGVKLGVDYSLTHSCYDPVGDLACSRCDSCQIRARGFIAAGVPDPTRYA